MRLKTLEIQGFKSFPDRTVINFKDGMTAIVGPNGSGKSNISDAVKWVLGETSSKSIRGNKMEDVIFGGSDKRRAMNFAEVSLTLDNSMAEANRINLDYDEITVTRRYTRTGDSEYFINRSPCRLRDISELFMNTGIGHSGYSIIGQGRVADIISQKSEDRRAIFEEAAGIAKYKYKKAEAERKLAEINDNLLRVGDIISEISLRLEPLKKDSDRAREYLDVYEQKKKTDTAIAVFDIGKIRAQLTLTDTEYNSAKTELAMTDDTLSELDAKNEKTFNSIQSAKLKYEQTVRRRHESDEARHSLESGILVLENDISHIKEQISNISQDTEIKNESLENLKLKHLELIKNLSTLKKQTADSQEIYDSDTSELCSVRTRISEIDTNTADNKKFISAKQSDAVDGKMKLSSIGGSHKSDIERREHLELDKSTLSENISLMENRIARAISTISDYAGKISDTEEKIKNLDTEYSAACAKKDLSAQKLNSLRLDLSSKNQRIDALRRMEELFEGYGQSVKTVMSESEIGTLTGIYGPISKIISVKKELSVAVETALGANIQNIVVDDENAAKSAISLLKKKNAGRATFYPISTVKSLPLNISADDMARYRGYVGIASELIEYDQKFAGIIGYMLGRTVVLDNIDNAAVMAKSFGYRIRIVTLDGQLINSGGSFTGGSVRRDSGILTRSAEIERINGDVLRLRGEIAAQTALISEQSKKAENILSERDEIKKHGNLINSLYQAENTQLEVMKNQRGGDTTRLETVSHELDALNSGLLDFETERQSLEKLIDSAQNEIAEKENINKTLCEQRIQLQNEADKLSDMLNMRMLKLTETKKDTEAAQNSLDFSTATVNSIQEQITRGEQIIYELNAKLIENANAIEKSKIDMAELERNTAELENKRESLNAEITSLELKSTEIKNMTRDTTHKRESIFREYTRLESSRAGISAEQDKITSKLWDDYELTYSACLELEPEQLNDSSRILFVSRQSELKNHLRNIGSVNTGAIAEYKEVSARYDFMSAQIDDLNKSKADFLNIIYKLENEMRLRFSDVMEEINANFKIVFAELFGGGSAELKLTDPDNLLESGIEINAAPPGKIVKSMSLLSGGEQAFVAIALFFAILKVNPVPFCILDEIEAALDDVNVFRFADYCRKNTDKTQFINITHRRGTMEAADILYGVTMYEKGISKILTLNVSEVESKIGIKI